MNFFPIAYDPPFEIMDAPVTQDEWFKVAGNRQSYFKAKPDNPVEQVSWNQVQAFIASLNHKNDGYTYRLPTEKEWEYCCRAGSTTAYYFGDDESKLEKYAWYCKNSNYQTQPVKQKLPNAFGLYDMHGNVWELCQDLWDDSGSYRVFRGGGWNYGAKYLRSAQRSLVTPDSVFHDLGFRLARTKALHSNPFTLEAAKRAEVLRQIKVIRGNLTKLERLLK